MASISVVVKADGSPFVSFAKLVDSYLEGSGKTLDGGSVVNLIRVENRFSPDDGGTLFTTLYPSDKFLQLAATLFDGDPE